MGFFRDLRKTFSRPNPFLRTNIVGPATPVKPLRSSSLTWSASGANDGYNNNEFDGVDLDEKDLSTYYLRLAQLQKYESSMVTSECVEIYSDYIKNTMIFNSDVIKIDQNSKYHHLETTINKVFNSLNVLNELSDNLSSFIYYGSHSFNTVKVGSKLALRNFHRPESCLRKFVNGVHTESLLLDDKSRVASVNALASWKIGPDNLSLVDRLSRDEDDIKSDIDLLKEVEFKASKPLFYSNIAKLKEYLLIDKLLTLLTIKELINPIIFLVSVNRDTSPDVGADLTSSIEKLLNNYTDTSSFLSGGFSVSELVNVLVNNIKVLPDYNDSMRNMGPLEFDKLIEKLNNLRGDQDKKRDELIKSTGIPPELFSGSMNKWEAIQRSHRLKSRVRSQVESIKNSLIKMACDIAKVYTDIDIDPASIRVACFTKTSIDYTNSIESAKQIQEMMDSMDRVLSTANSTLENYTFINKTRYFEIIIQQLNNIGPEFSDLITEASIKEYLKKLDSDEGGGKSRW